MDKGTARVTVWFEAPFWVGVYERTWNGRAELCKIRFGAEPKDYEVYEFLLRNWGRLPFRPSTQEESVCRPVRNPKRMQRQVQRELRQGVGTKAQQALKLQQEQRKQERKQADRERKAASDLHRFARRQSKRKAKHRGH